MGDCNNHFRIEMIRYLSENWKKNISLEKAASSHGYSKNHFNTLFKENFGMSFSRFFIKLKLHGAAMMISQRGSLMNIGKTLGYDSAQSFSKAFHKEFGLSPKQFLASDQEIPDMPVHYHIQGEPVWIEYTKEQERVIHGELITPIHGNETDMMEEAGYYYEHICKEQYPLADSDDELIEMWWHDEQCNIHLVVGRVQTENTDAPKDRIKIVMPPDYYAVVSVRVRRAKNLSKGSDDSISSIVKELNHFIFKEWKIINGKQFRRMGYTFTRYRSAVISIYIPVNRRNVPLQEITPKFKGANAWIEYVDNHLKDNLTVGQLAEAFHYSERHFTDTFEMYYGVRPGQYIRKRRLYLAARELRRGEQNLNKLVENYGFHSLEVFRKSFSEEFCCHPERYEGEEYNLVNLAQYYVYHKKTLVFRYEELKDFAMAGRNVSSYLGLRGEDGDLIESIVWSLRSDSSEQQGDRGEGQIVVWQSAKERREHYCLVGPMLAEEEAEEKYNYKVKIRGGYYIIMETLHESDAGCLAESYRMLYRCAFGGWIRENQERVDLKRLTFVRYKGGKLQFYIPIHA